MIKWRKANSRVNSGLLAEIRFDPIEKITLPLSLLIQCTTSSDLIDGSMYKEIFNGEKNFDKISLAKVKLLVAMQRATDDGLKRRSNFVRCKVDSILKRNKRNI